MGNWLIDTAGIGSIIVIVVGSSVFGAYLYMLRWIQTTPPNPASTEIDQLEATESGGEEG